MKERIAQALREAMQPGSVAPPPRPESVEAEAKIMKKMRLDMLLDFLRRQRELPEDYPGWDA